jgi:LCP family protein required for cell wall assembly
VRGQGRLARALSVLAAVLSFAVLASAVGGYALVKRYDGNITRANVDLGGDRSPDAPRNAQNILIVGSDSRGDLAAGQGTQGTGKTFVTGQRSDTVILAHLFGDADTAQLVSFPRDSWVTIPAHVDETGKPVAARESKLNSAFFEGGPALLIDTIEGLTGLHVDRYMQVDFDGFQTIVNRLDGVEVCLSEAAKEKDSGIDLQAGRQTIKGPQALAFVRQRKGLPNGDIDRIRRQQQFIGGIVRKVLSAGTLANPLRLNGVIDAATDALVVDSGRTSCCSTRPSSRRCSTGSGATSPRRRRTPPPAPPRPRRWSYAPAPCGSASSTAPA